MKKILLIVALLICVIGVVGLVIDSSKAADAILNGENNEPDEQKTMNEDVQAVQALFEESLEASNEENSEKYVALLIPKARKNTQKELENFFDEYTVKNTLQSFKLLKHDGEHLLAEARVKSVKLDKSTDKYKDHIATSNVTFVKINGEWLIEMTTMIHTQFLE
ncbi:hypothetical protein A5844_001716 [Enterococcus sp. 10A9_DIV0425]|uniref:DUF4878 domain-containing protein n=1 Tax=Candidatus Enterococcus wittei TaxID=1987383 RepID=A0A242JY21_9ENTE|nr:hypothetical protein [Enterococcus sp. 10A9_DIV0425]OTP10019.1 hypothetical protein A5844_001716 [Enterococcus sp. 10A9_DIV0425]THE12071.1 hypothetical protein E1H99_07880 [Enterococcus hirae]